jgi:porin
MDCIRPGCRTDDPGPRGPGSSLKSGPFNPRRQTLTDDWFGYGPALRDAGLNLRVDWTQFYQGMFQGVGDTTGQYGGHLDGLAKIDLSKLGLWDGLSLTAQGTINYGNSVNGFDGTAFPVNSALFFPDLNTTDGATVSALFLNQDFGNGWSVSIGKFNNIEAVRARPILGGGGVDTFWNLNPAVTSSGLIPGGIYAAQVGLKTDPVSYSLMLYDPEDAFNKFPFEKAFQNGIGVNGTATLKTSIAGRTGYYGISASYHNAQRPNLGDIVVQGSGGVGNEINNNISGRVGAYAVALTMQQYLYQDPNDPAKGWGVFGALTRSDANPTPFELSYMFGIGGNSFLPNRSDDRFGIALSRFGLSTELKNELAQFSVQDEYALEAFYNIAVTPWLRTTVDVQWVRPAGGTFPDGMFAGVSTYAKF